MAVLFAALAALVPTAASIWVAVRALLRHRKSEATLQRRVKVEERAETTDRLDRIGGKASTGKPHVFTQLDRQREGYGEVEDAERRARASMTELPLSKAQVVDQWTLIVAAVAGVICWGISQLLLLLCGQ